MNYYERHIGDYLKDTAHLTLLEHGVYTRLLDVYYTRESALPDDQVGRLIAARTKDEKDALHAVLEEFFYLEAGLWHQNRCDVELENFSAKQAEKDAGKEGAKERQRRARERRKALFHALREAGQVPSFNTSTVELELMLSRVTGSDMSHGVTPHVTRDNTATQTPITNHQSPDPSINTNQATLDPAFPSEKPPEEAGAATPETTKTRKSKLPDCPHLRVLELWSEVLPAMPQHNPDMWDGARADHLRTRWRETASTKSWADQDAGLAYFRKLFAYVGKSPFLTGQTRSSDPSKRPFTIELEWLVNKTNWAKVHEGKYHSEA